MDPTAADRTAQRVAFWVTAGGRHGGGHLFRALALIEELPPEWEVALVVPDNEYTRSLDMPEQFGLLRQPESHGWKTSGLFHCLAQHGWAEGPDLIVIDGLWEPDNRLTDELRLHWNHVRIAVIGGPERGGPEVDLRVIPDPGYQPAQESVRDQPRDRILGGSRYVILGRTGEPADWRPPRDPARVLITAGNADPFDVTSVLVRTLNYCKIPLEATVVIGGGFLHADSAREQIAASGANIRVVERVHDLRPLMTECDLALVAYGITCLELAQMGVPAVVGTHTKDDVYYAGRLEQLGFLRVAGWVTEISPGEIAEVVDELLGSPEALSAMSAAGRRFIDDRGARRVAQRLRGLVEPMAGVRGEV